MIRSYRISELITLPRLDALGADTLTTETLTAGNGKTLPAPVVDARNDLVERQKPLQSALTARVQSLPLAKSPRARKADRAEDAAFSATFYWLVGYSKLPEGTKEAATAKRLLGVLFRDGLKFTKLPFKIEWAEADARLRAIAEDPTLEAAFTELHGEIFLANLRVAHKEYGEALGITAAKAAATQALSIQAPLDAVREALRTYVLRVLAHTEGELADALLSPITTWESRQAAAAEPPPQPDDTPPGAAPV